MSWENVEPKEGQKLSCHKSLVYGEGSPKARGIGNTVQRVATKPCT